MKKAIPQHYKVNDQDGNPVELLDAEKLAIQKAIDTYHKAQQTIYKRILERING